MGRMGETTKYEGGCHCGAVRYEVDLESPKKAFACNCSICSRAGWLLAFAPMESFRLLAGEDVLRDYQFNQKKAHHLFCSTCGIRSFSRGPGGPEGKMMVAVNLRCLSGFDATGLPVETFDGAKL
jgi:hypothetical protein